MNQNKLLLMILTASGLFFGDLARQSLILAQSDETKPTFEASDSLEEGIKANEGPGQASDTLAEKEGKAELEEKRGGVSYPSLASFKLIQERNIFDLARVSIKRAWVMSFNGITFQFFGNKFLKKSLSL